ncbi:hypothetical protein BLS_008538 [Venturia inaequalis]|uniref:Vacuolar protein sorting-associated protein 62 n=1 Tax=Venturia inaequalis TaxID=5025 RepID=A0A8H3UYT5_VENIN|nr:hypothetical protein BLS_008538 [Venturia inaequalis]KAE9966069.1 hypothetical protein EG328_009194 [Venturia inaequalis]KAE9979051.1 hypothetical protein EG327_007174 [Venturia inaequalis]RDI81724.1 hypothetical protein Vi05172_g8216 [Venturia inaequalis]
MKVFTIRKALAVSTAGLITVGFLLAHYGTVPMTSEALEDSDWIASSKYWLDRKACRWFALCGLAHSWSRTPWKDVVNDPILPPTDFMNTSSYWDSGPDPSGWSDREKMLRKIPQYVIDHAPYVYLYSGEEFWPSDMSDHLVHTTPHLNYTPVTDEWRHPDLTNLSSLNEFRQFVFLKSDDNVETRPKWLGSAYNIPAEPERNITMSEHFPGRQGHWRWHPHEGVHEDPELDKWWRVKDNAWDGPSDEDLEDDGPGPSSANNWQSSHSVKTKPNDPLMPPMLGHEQAQELRKRGTPVSAGGRSDAPVVMVVVDKGEGIVDAFWFYFYSYNLGNKVFNIRFGDHVGDWEHTAIRFYNGEPKAIFFSEHDAGAAYSWDAVEKIGDRPVSYSAEGTHAMYATPGVHTYVLPFGLLHDVTDRGPLWDPVLNLQAFTYDYKKDVLRSSNLNPKAPTDWFFFWGHWGDKFYPLNDRRQYRFAGQYHYVNGPMGPRFKRLGRKRICQGGNDEACAIKYWINERLILRSGVTAGSGEVHDMEDEDTKRFLGDLI